MCKEFEKEGAKERTFCEKAKYALKPEIKSCIIYVHKLFSNTEEDFIWALPF